MSTLIERALLARKLVLTVALWVVAGGCGGADGGGDSADASPQAIDAPIVDPAPVDAADAGPPKPAPPQTVDDWISDHRTRMSLLAYDDHVAIYVDDEVTRRDADWILPLTSKAFQYAKRTYDPQVQYGPDRLTVFIHQGQFHGGTISSYFDEFSDFRNALDVGADSWVRGDNIDLLFHEMGHIVEGSSNGIHESPAFEVWSDSKWCEIFQYDLYLAVGLTADADRVFARYNAQEDDFPRAGTHWFRDFFHPAWRDHGKAKVLSSFFRLLSGNFPTEPENNGRNPIYSRRMNLGEFVHFMSGAAGADLSGLARTSFGNAFATQLMKAKTDFSNVTY